MDWVFWEFLSKIGTISWNDWSSAHSALSCHQFKERHCFQLKVLMVFSISDSCIILWNMIVNATDPAHIYSKYCKLPDHKQTFSLLANRSYLTAQLLWRYLRLLDNYVTSDVCFYKNINLKMSDWLSSMSKNAPQLWIGGFYLHWEGYAVHSNPSRMLATIVSSHRMYKWIISYFHNPTSNYEFINHW